MEKDNNNMYKLYDEYKDSLKLAKKARGKRQKLNAEMREKYKSPFRRDDYRDNKNDISNWNSMISDLEEDMKMIEMYLDFDDRHYLHKEYFNTKSMILNKNSHEGEIPLEEMFNETTPDATELVCIVELQKEIIELLDEVLTERQKQIVWLYYWQEKTQEEIGKVFGVTKQAVSEMLTKSLKILKDVYDYNYLSYFK